MEIILSRILKFVNGALEDNSLFRVATFIITHYHEIMDDYSLDDFVEQSHCTKEEIIDFINHFGLYTYKDFVAQLKMDYELRLSQIGLRMIGATPEKYMKHLQVNNSKDDFVAQVKKICELFFKCERIVIIASHYPSAVAVDFQTDLITLGKEVIEYHRFVKGFRFKETDVVIVISATGRTLDDYGVTLKNYGLCDAYILLITQNPRLANYNDVCADEVIQITGKYDGMMFNHQLMSVFDVFRIVYFKQYYE